MRLNVLVCLVLVVALREASSSTSTMSTLGYAAVLVLCGGFSLCACGLELLAFVVIATYVVVFLVLFVVVLGWRGADLSATRASSYGLVAMIAAALSYSWLTSYLSAPSADVVGVTSSYSSHYAAIGASQVSFAHVMQTLFARLFLVELVAVNVVLLCGFQLVSSVLTVFSTGSRQAVAATRVRRTWRRTSSSRHVQ